MISPRTAQRLIARHCFRLSAIESPIVDSLGHVLAEDIRSPHPLPHFDNSAMDGFAVRTQDTAKSSASRPVYLSIRQRVLAGDTSRRTLRRGESCRIMTGAPLPAGADAVIMKEEAVVEGSCLVIRRAVRQYAHVRRKGEEVKKGDIVLTKGAVIHPGTVGCLAVLGRASVSVIRKPVVSVITTGDEAVPLGEKLLKGQIYDSNSHMLAAMLRQMGIESIRHRSVRDHPPALANAVRAAMAHSDILVAVGGISVGDRDYLRAVFNRLRVREVFWRVGQKPGKPLFFGVKGKRLVFGLPGNPASAFTCFYMYVYPAVRRLAGFDRAELLRTRAVAGSAIAANKERWLFMKGNTPSRSYEKVEPLPKQGSHMITSLPKTNRIIVVEPKSGEIGPGDDVTTYQMPYSEDTYDD